MGIILDPKRHKVQAPAGGCPVLTGGQASVSTLVVSRSGTVGKGPSGPPARCPRQQQLLGASPGPASVSCSAKSKLRLVGTREAQLGLAH